MSELRSNAVRRYIIYHILRYILFAVVFKFVMDVLFITIFLTRWTVLHLRWTEQEMFELSSKVVNQLYLATNLSATTCRFTVSIAFIAAAMIFVPYAVLSARVLRRLVPAVLRRPGPFA